MSGVREHLARHIALAQELASWIDADPDFERLAPVPFSVVCFRWRPAERQLTDEEIDLANERLMNRVNRTGQAFLSHTRVNGHFALRIAIGHERTQAEHVRQVWTLLSERPID